MAYVKLSNALITSTIWQEPDASRIVWITMLVLADRNGEVMGTIPGIANIARVTIEECEAALKRFAEPDQYSRSKEDEGRRIQEIDGGWSIINHQRYRDMDNEADRKRKAAERQQRYITRKKAGDRDE